jgi:hypothetical protein
LIQKLIEEAISKNVDHVYIILSKTNDNKNADKNKKLKTKNIFYKKYSKYNNNF